MGLILQQPGGAPGLGITELVYMLAALLFILGLKRLSGVKTARRGNQLAAIAMLIAVSATMFVLWNEVALWILFAGVIVGGGLGLFLAKRVPMTDMPELVAFFNGMGGAASMFVALAEIARFSLSKVIPAEEGVVPTLSSLVKYEDGSFTGGPDFALAIVASILIGAVTLSGSLIAYGKLSGKVNASRFGPIGIGGANIAMGLVAIALCWFVGFGVEQDGAMLACALLLTVLALVLGVGLVVPIGGADMPVVISLLNSYSGLAAAATGFVLQNNLLIVSGSLVGASGLILTRIMCKAMNRSLANVLFSGFGEEAEKDDSEYTTVTSAGAEDLAPIFEAARSVVIVPGYGLAVAQAQHKVRELGDLLKSNGTEVRYAIHPVAGRMPGHMNVLLAEADVPYEELFELDNINSDFKNTDVALVIGANDVCNPAASDPNSPIAGMPVLDVWDAQTVVVVKRSLSPGYAGIKNELFQMDNSLMYFADGKKAIEDLITEVKDL